MYVWELISCRLRVDGWHVRHSTRDDPYGSTYTVHLQRQGFAYEASGPTLTEAYAAAARRARDLGGGMRLGSGPHFPRTASMSHT
jgi:hypothetical protein